jgi:hypothetical protein
MEDEPYECPPPLSRAANPVGARDVVAGGLRSKSETIANRSHQGIIFRRTSDIYIEKAILRLMTTWSGVRMPLMLWA